MNFKIIPIIATGFSSRFFTLPVYDEDWSDKPHLKLTTSLNATFALQMGDSGLDSIGIVLGDYLLFSVTNPLLSAAQLSLVRNEDEEYIIREAYWTSDTTILRTPGPNPYSDKVLPTENLRIIAVLDNVIKPHDELEIVYFR